MMPMILTVYLSDGEQAVTEVPITPETTCRDVVEFCKEPGESGCHLAEVWRGNERAIPFEHMMYEHMQKWGPRKQEVKFFLRHEDSPTESSDQGVCCLLLSLLCVLVFSHRRLNSRGWSR